MSVLPNTAVDQVKIKQKPTVTVHLCMSIVVDASEMSKKNHKTLRI